MSVRIIAGRWRGRVLGVPAGDQTRPTLGRARESLFGILTPWLEGARVLDAYAGSGALGLEALSRGAAFAVFLEQAAPALTALRRNLGALDAEEQTLVVARDARRALATPDPPGGAPFDLVLIDPPYGRGLAAEALELLGTHADRWLSDHVILAAQVGRRDPLPPEAGPLTRFRESLYGETRVDFYRR